MNLRPESEISVIRQHIDGMKSQPWLDQARQWWPACLFHCTDIRNVVSILEQGELGSRSLVTSSGLLQMDIASPAIIQRTNPKWHDHVRLYFRPKAPTQYNNEGFRPVSKRARNSHCPVPIYLIFDAAVVLSRTDSHFSDGNLSSSLTKVDSDVSFLGQIPFDLVYHSERFDESDRQEIVRRRHAEVLVPRRMELDGLRSIVCRSDAEYKTLLQLLSPESHSRWARKIGVLAGLQLFHREWTFVEQVDMDSQRIVFRFNRSSRTPSPFNASVEIEETLTGRRYHWQDSEFSCDRELPLHLSNLRDPSDYAAHLFLDGQLAFSNRYQEYDDLPF